MTAEMSGAAAKERQDLHAYLQAQEDKDLLRFLTCGSVDDGKSTLIGRLLYDSKMIFEDQLAALEKDSRKFGTQGTDIDFALLVDGLAAEREQGITIDVAYRFFATDKRHFIVADTPGHEQYTRNMATGASTADLALILVDARQGILTQTRRHSFICALLGIRQIVLVVNKMDLVDYDRRVFEQIRADYLRFAEAFDLERVDAVPISALKGDNILGPSTAMPWYEDASLMRILETADVTNRLAALPFRFPVQWVNRPDLDFRGYAGTVASGSIAVGDRVAILPGGNISSVREIVSFDGAKQRAETGEAVAVTLTNDIDISRGQILSLATERPEVTDQLQAEVIWLHEEPMLPGRSYLMKTCNQVLPATVTELRHRVNVNSMEHEAARTLELNDVGECNLSLGHPIAFDSYRANPATGAFILIDRISNATVGAGMINFGLRRATNIHWQSVVVDKISRAEQKHQSPCVLWFTGLSGSGKSTIANILEQKLQSRDKHTYLLDGDNVRHGLNRDLGFTDADRVENIRRVAEVSKLMVDAGLLTLVSFISPFRAERRMAREMMGDREFLEIFVDTPLEVCQQRDPKGLYEKALRGEIKNFTGLDSPYEQPETAELVINTTQLAPEAAADAIIDFLEHEGYLARQNADC